MPALWELPYSERQMIVVTEDDMVEALRRAKSESIVSRGVV